MTDTSQIRPFRACGVVLLQIIVAVFGVPALEAPIGSILKLVIHWSASIIIIQEWICSIVLGGFFGAAIYLRWKPRSAQWLWIAGLVVFLIGCWQLRANMIQPWHVLSGIECAEYPGFACIQFWEFSAPFIRLTAYSAGALLASRLSMDSANRVSVVSSYFWSTIMMKTPDLVKDPEDHSTGKTAPPQ